MPARTILTSVLALTAVALVLLAGLHVIVPPPSIGCGRSECVRDPAAVLSGEAPTALAWMVAPLLLTTVSWIGRRPRPPLWSGVALTIYSFLGGFPTGMVFLPAAAALLLAALIHHGRAPAAKDSIYLAEQVLGAATLGPAAYAAVAVFT